MPTNAELRKFVDTEGWQDKDKAAGRRKGDHHRYLLVLADGTTLYTRISHGRGGVDDPKLFAAILRDQLQVTEEQFWACVRQGVKPPRPGATRERPANAIDGKLAWRLHKQAGLSQQEIQTLTPDEALQRWLDYVRERDSPDP